MTKYIVVRMAKYFMKLFKETAYFQPQKRNLHEFDTIINTIFFKIDNKTSLSQNINTKTTTASALLYFS